MKLNKLSIEISPVEKINTHVDSTSPPMSFDQMSIMAYQRQAETSNTLEWADPQIPSQLNLDNMCNSMNHVQHNKLTRTKLKGRETCKELEASEFKQLDQFLEQKIFGKPCIPKSNGNLLPLIWTHETKPDGAKKARCVCNGSPCQKGTVTLGNTCTASLEQSGSRLFWDLASLPGCQVHGADATNACSEAPPPLVPLHVTIDE